VAAAVKVGGAISVPTNKVDAAQGMNLHQYSGGGDLSHGLYKGLNILAKGGPNNLSRHVAAALAGGAISVQKKKVDAAICMNLHQWWWW
jgi:hypothetical protein